MDANDDGVTDLVTLSQPPQVLDVWDGKDGANLWTHKPLFDAVPHARFDRARIVVGAQRGTGLGSTVV